MDKGSDRLLTSESLGQVDLSIALAIDAWFENTVGFAFCRHNLTLFINEVFDAALEARERVDGGPGCVNKIHTTNYWGTSIISKNYPLILIQVAAVPR